MRIALAQIDSTDDVALNLEKISGAVLRARVGDPSLVVFPEYSMYEKRVVDRTFADIAEPIDGPFGSAMSALAEQHGVTLVVGLVETNPLDLARPFNTVGVFGADGSLLGRHRKVHLYDEGVFRESAWISESDDLRGAVVDVGNRRIGLMTCNDLRHPDMGMQLSADGADLVVVCASWVPGPRKVEQWRVLVQARAVENRYPVVAVSQAEPISIGNSLIVLPDSTIVAQLGGSAEVLTTELLPHLGHL